jgi:hypothetical protein
MGGRACIKGTRIPAPRHGDVIAFTVVTTLVPHLADEAALRGRLWIVEETRIRVRQ